MKKTSTASRQGALAALLLAASMPVTPAEPAARTTANQPAAKQTAPNAKMTTAILYEPPRRGSPKGRVGGGTRAPHGRQSFILDVFAPDHTGWTSAAQPTLFWSISAPIELPVKLTIANLSDGAAMAPMLETQLSLTAGRGTHEVRLADFAVELKPGVTYQWSVSVMPDPERPARDILASGMIERVEPMGALAAQPAAAPDLGLARLFAQNGYWYDAFEVVSRLIQRDPADQTARGYRAALLEQVGLAKWAER